MSRGLAGSARPEPDAPLATSAHDFLVGGGEMGALMRAHDWTRSPLGPPALWPQSLRTVVSLLLNSKFPMFVAWGPELAFLYNDGYRPIFGSKHPHALGLPFREVWSEIWEDILPLVEQALGGEGTFSQDFHLVMERNGYPEDTWFTFSYSPVRDESGGVGGMFCACTETTSQVFAEEALRKSEERQRTIVEATPECVKIVAHDGRLLHMNPAGLRMIEAEAMERVSGADVFQIIAPEYRDEWRRQHRRICAGESLNWEFDIVGLAGSRRRMETHAVPLPMPDGTTAQLAVTRDITARTEAEAALRASEAQLRALADNLPYGMVYQVAMQGDGSDRRFTFVSQSSERLSGVSAEEALRNPAALYDTILPEHRATLAEAEEVAIAQCAPMDVEVGFRQADGSPGWCRIISAPRPGPDGAILWDGLLVDVTDRREAEAALRESEDHYRHTVELNPQVSWTSAPDGQLDHVSQRWLEWTGTTGLGESWERAIHPDDLTASIDAWMHSVATGEPYDIEHRICLLNGSYRWMHSRAYPRRDESGRVIKWYGTTEDIEERKAATRRLRDSEERFRSLVEATTAVVWTTEAGGGIERENPSWAAFTGQTAEDYRGWGWLEAVHPEDRERTAEVWRAALAACTPYECEYRLRRHDGEYRATLARGVPIKSADGQIREWIGANADITARKRAEEHQILLINELNHRVKNTLATVQSIAAQTFRNAPTMEEARDAFENRLLALSRAHDVLTRENWEGAGLREIVAQAVEPYSHARESRVQVTGRNIRLTPRMALALAMALQELATNAVKYGALSNAVGKVVIGWTVDRAADPPRLRLRWEETGGPTVAPPRRRGFGSRLIERSLAHDLDGVVHIDFAPTGVVCTIEAPLAPSA